MTRYTNSGAPWWFIILFWFGFLGSALWILVFMVAAFTGFGACAVLGECY